MMNVVKREKRSFSLILILVLFTLTNLVVLYILLFKSAEYNDLFPEVSASQMQMFSIIPLATLIGIIGLWNGKTWGLITVSLTFLSVLVIDLAFRISAHLALVSIAYMGLILLFFKEEEH